MGYSTILEIVNKAAAKIGGIGDQAAGNQFLANLTGTDKVTTFVNTAYPQVRRQVITDLAQRDCPFIETFKYADLGDDIKQNDLTISDITIGAGPTYTITITTESAHEYSTGDTVCLFDIQGDGGIDLALNNRLFTITVTTTTAFTLDSTIGAAAYDYTADSGIVSDAPEIGDWAYAFNLPSDFFVICCQLDEGFGTTLSNRRQRYRCEIVLNKDSNGKLLLTNDYSNYDGDSAFVKYCIDQTDVTLFSDALVDCIATLLAAEMCPVCGRNLQVKDSMLQQYYGVAIPKAMTFNQSQSDNQSKKINDYLGGRGNTDLSLTIPNNAVYRAE